MKIKYPEISVQLSGESANAYAILGAVTKALKRALPREEAAEAVAEFRAEATSGDYDHLLATAMRWVDIS
jgi:uncharacterized protein (DUF2267 family)